MKEKFILFCIFVSNLFITLYPQKAPHIITFFLKPVEKSVEEEIQKAELKKEIEKKKKVAPEKADETKISQPRKVLKKLFSLQTDTNTQTGVYASYAGNTTFSDIHGQIKFNRKTPEPTIQILVTRDIKPVPIHPDKRFTISGFVVNPKADAKLYSFKREKDPKNPKRFYWIVSEKPFNINKLIPYNTIILFSKPKYVIVNLGKFETIAGENLLLPDIYIRKNPGAILNPLIFLKNRYFFAPIKKKYEFKPLEVQEQII